MLHADAALRADYALVVLRIRFGRRRRWLRVVELRKEREGRDRRWLDARLLEDGSLRIDGHDLGPATKVVSSDGEYEWSYRYPPSSVGMLLSALGGADGQDILDLLEDRYTGRRSYDLEAVLRETKDTIPSEFWSWRNDP